MEAEGTGRGSVRASVVLNHVAGAARVDTGGPWERSEEYLPFDFAQLNFTERYKLMCAAVVPRPIGFISTVSKTGVHNLAPLSFFNCVTSAPPTVMFALTTKPDDSRKDTWHNIMDTSEFVVNHVSLPMFPQVYQASTEYPPDVSEFEMAGLTPIPSAKVKPPRVKESPLQMECKLHTTVEIGDGKYGGATIVVGEILYMHIWKSCYQNGRIVPEKLQTVSRLGEMCYGGADVKFEYHGKAWSEKNW